jgi:hypothetical protein
MSLQGLGLAGTPTLDYPLSNYGALEGQHKFTPKKVGMEVKYDRSPALVLSLDATGSTSATNN